MSPGRSGGRVQEAGDLVRYWRGARGMSQMALAHAVGVSPRHLSFVETGRSRASRRVLLRIAERLDIPDVESNALLEAAGHAREHRERELADPEMDQVRRVLRFLLDRHEPHSALVFDRHWNIVMTNAAHREARDAFLEGRAVPAAVRDNLLRLTFHPDGLRSCIVNWHVVGPVLLTRVERELAESPSDARLGELVDEVRGYGPVPSAIPRAEVPAGVLLPVHLRRGPLDVRLVSVLSTLGSATDVTLQGLRLETFFPADPESEAALSMLSEAGRSLAGE